MFGFGARFALFETMFFIVFFIVMAAFVVTIGKSLLEWNKNNHSPRLTVPAVVVTKRTDVHHHRHDGHTHHSTRYYAAFEVESGDRMELQLSGQEYGLLVEGDAGELTFQGTRFLGFERK
jgi:hypothetical protein